MAVNPLHDISVVPHHEPFNTSVLSVTICARQITTMVLTKIHVLAKAILLEVIVVGAKAADMTDIDCPDGKTLLEVQPVVVVSPPQPPVTVTYTR